MSEPTTSPGRGREKMCYPHPKYKITVHCFQPGQCRCTCGEIVIRRQVRRKKIGNFGRGQSANFSA